MIESRLTAGSGSDSTSRVEWVDKAKGICIILVVMMHTTLGIERVSGELGWMHAVVDFARPFRMPDFFMISGLFLAATINRPWRLYLDRKVLHFFYFYVLWVTIQFAVKSPFMLMDGQTMGTVLRSLLFAAIQPFGTLWFIYMLPVFFVVTKLFKRTPWALFAAAAFLQIIPVNTSNLLQSMTQTFAVVSVDSYWLLVDEFCSFFVYFLAGYLFAPRIFDLAERARRNVTVASVGLVVWFAVNMIMVANGWAALPLISLAMGGLGAIAIVTMASILARLGWSGALSHLGANSIVVYLAFFLPMIITRLVLLKFTPWMDPGTMAALATAIAVVTPLIGYAIIKRLGWGLFLFHRPQWAIMAEKPSHTKASLQPAE